MTSKALWITAGVVFAAGVALMIIRGGKKAASSANSVAVADETSAQVAAAAKQHIDVDDVGAIH